MLKVDSVMRGVVLDHIQAGKSMEIYRHLQLDRLDCSVAIIKNAKSNRMGRKDIIKIEDMIDLNLEVLGFIDDQITVNIIDDDRVIEKKRLSLPQRVVDVIQCKNPRCITSVEQELPHVFELVNPRTKTYKCTYCEQEYTRKD